MPRSILRFGACMVLGGSLFVAGLSAEEQPVGKAPAFGAADLMTLPARNWITNGGNIYNQRYSALDSNQSRQRQGRQGRLARRPERFRRRARVFAAGAGAFL